VKRRPVSPFSLSFLDIMFCGFGAVVLLVLILNHDTVRSRETTFADLRADAVALQQQAIGGRRRVAEERAALERDDAERVASDDESEAIANEIAMLERAIADMTRVSLAKKEAIEQLTSDLDRQYLTGLKVGGKRILILVDASASMLDETLVNVIRRRNMGDERKRAAPKWRRTLATAEWLVSQLPRGARFQLVAFNTRAWASAGGSGLDWLGADSREQVTRAVDGLLATIPGGGTSLERAFEVAKRLEPRPDNVILVTDGLPTQGRGKPRGTTVSADARLKHYFSAVRALPEGIPVNTILLPMEGDAYAAAAYWQLAANTGGSFLTPARDWP
jgi:hypothetical protein